jgi:predicted TIM-barrel fold metal-dependent hydrolase
MPRSEKDADGRHETVHVDGQRFRRRLPVPSRGLGDDENGLTSKETQLKRAKGAMDSRLRLQDLDAEGIWGECIFPSLGLWTASIRDPDLIRAGAQTLNDWAYEEFIQVSPRYVPAATVSLLNVEDAVAELQRVAGLGFRVMFSPVGPPIGQPAFSDPHWEPLWSELVELNMVLAFHIGTEPFDMAANSAANQNHKFRGPGGTVLNYTATTLAGQMVACEMIASGVLDRHPDLKVFVVEAGSMWAPFMGDRMAEGYRQLSGWVHPKLKLSPKEYIFRQVYTSFQHDVTAVQTMQATGYDKILWGSDYPHLEGTFGHTQETLHGLLDSVDEKIKYRITNGTFLELFPEVGEAPGAEKK